MMAAPSPTEGWIFWKIPYKKSFSLALFWQKTLDAVADCSKHCFEVADRTCKASLNFVRLLDSKKFLH
ncbi:hypothetical protein DHL47_12625 [Streptococcus panodentis]|uniref:Uncharacterized protein n=1 Tax=Streptococcus panodentis TaxID=1581472 RepID=A0ABS5AZY7_9STRE|nr:hypothetical protein [Streptococcus panodentis]